MNDNNNNITNESLQVKRQQETKVDEEEQLHKEQEEDEEEEENNNEQMNHTLHQSFDEEPASPIQSRLKSRHIEGGIVDFLRREKRPLFNK